MQKKHKVLIAVLSFTFLVFAGLGILVWKLQETAEHDEMANAFVMGGYLGIGESLMESHLYSIAQPVFEKALSVAQQVGDNDIDRAEAITRIGQCLRRQKQIDPALATFQKAADLFGNAEKQAEDCGLPMFRMDKRMYLKCLHEYALTLKENGKAAESEKLTPKIEKLTKELGPVEALRQKMSSI